MYIISQPQEKRLTRAECFLMMAKSFGKKYKENDEIKYLQN